MKSINIPEYFFNPLVSKHKFYYIDIFLQIERIISDSDRLALKRSLVLQELKRHIERNHRQEDISDEEDYKNEEHTEDSLSADIAYIIRKFIKSKWLDVDDNGDYNSDLIFITYEGKELSRFLCRLSDNNEQSGYVLSVYNNLQSVSAMVDYGYVNIKNAYENTQDLRTSLEMMYSRIKEYYSEQLKENSPQEILKSHFEGYLKDVIDKVIFPLKVDDSIHRFKMPIIELVNSIFENTSLQNKIVESAKQMKRISDIQNGREQLWRMLNYIRKEFKQIDDIVMQLDEKNNVYTRITRQKLTYMLNMDTSIKGNIISILKDSEDNSDEIYEKIQQCIMLYDIAPITEEGFYKERKQRVYSNENPVEIEDNLEIDEAEARKVIDVYGAKFIKSKVNGYAKRILDGKETLVSNELEIETDDDYVMSIILATNSGDYDCCYEFELGDDTVHSGIYKIPNFVMKEKKRNENR